MRIALVILLAFSVPLNAQMWFGKVELRTNYGTVKQGQNGRIVVAKDTVKFVTSGGAEAISIPSDAMTEVFYSRVAGRRIKTALALGVIFFFSKGKKHYMTLSFNEDGGEAGAVEFKLHKSNYRGTLRAVEEVTGLSAKYDLEGVKASRETFSSRGDSRVVPDVVLSITSEPPLAEVYINGSFNGLTPRKKAVQPGEYSLEIRKAGFKSWSQVVAVDHAIDVHAELEK